MQTNNFLVQMKTEVPGIKMRIDITNIWPLAAYFLIFSSICREEGVSNDHFNQAITPKFNFIKDF